MKHLHLFGAMALMAVAPALTSCSNSDDDAPSSAKTIKFEFAKADFTSEGQWVNCYDAAYDNSLIVDGLTFHRSALSTEWDGIVYNSWKGFTPSISTDKTEHAGQWITYQWGAITGKPAAGNGYMLGCWDAQEPLTVSPDYEVPQSKSVCITSAVPFSPAAISITNSCYTYYTMLRGDDFCHKFTKEDWLRLYIHGTLHGEYTSTVVFDLANGTDIITGWQTVDISSLDNVDAIYFQMASSDSGQWGMNTPAYFCLGALTLK